MTQAQINHYRALWGDVRRVLRRQGLSSAECEKRRHALHVEALGRDVSSTALTNKQFDLVKGKFLAISQPANLAAQERAEDGDRIRRRQVVADLCSQLDYDDDNLQGTIDRMQREGRLREPDRPRATDEVEAWDIERTRESVQRLTFNDLDADELDTVIIALRLQVRREAEQRAVEHAAPCLPF